MSLPLEKLSDLTPRHTIDIERPWFSPEPNRQVALETLAEYFASGLPAPAVTVADDAARFALTAEQAPTGTLVQVTATGNNYIVVDTAELDNEDGYVILPPAGPAKVVVRQGTTAEIAAVTLDSGEIAYATDTKYVYMGDGVTLGGILWSRGSLIIAASDAAAAGTNLGGSGTPGSAGSGTLAFEIRAGNGGDNSATGTGNGGNGGALNASAIRIRGGLGGTGGDGDGGNGGTVTALNIVGGNGGNGVGVGSGTGDGGTGGTNRGILVAGGSGGNGGASANGGAGGQAKGSGALDSAIRVIAGNGGNGADAVGGAGGESGGLALTGGNGGNASGATPGAAGGRGSRITGAGSAAVTSTAGANAGDITLSANGARAGGSINTSAGASFAGGSIDLSNGGNSMTIQGTSGQIGHRVAVPVSSASSGAVGQWASDDSYLYVYGATGWRRLAASTF